MSDQPPATCASCGHQIAARDAVVVIGLERFHVPCWQVSTSAAVVRSSRTLARRSGQKIPASQERIERTERTTTPRPA